MIEFMKCHRDLEHPSLSMSSLAVVLGPASSGKSLFLKSCLRELAQSDAGKGSRLVVLSEPDHPCGFFFIPIFDL